MEDNLISLLI